MKSLVVILSIVASALSVFAQSDETLSDFFNSRWSDSSLRDVATCQADSGHALLIKFDEGAPVQFYFGKVSGPESLNITMQPAGDLVFKVEQIVEGSDTTIKGTFSLLSGRMVIDGRPEIIFQCSRIAIHF